MEKYCLLQQVFLVLRFYSWRPFSLNCELGLLVTVGALALTRLVFYGPWGIAASCVDVAVCHVPVIIQQCCFWTFLWLSGTSVCFCNASQACSVWKRIDGFVEKSICLSINRFFCLRDHQVGLSLRVHMEGNQAGFMFPLSWVLHWRIHLDFRVTERLSWRLFSTSTNGAIYSALMGSILTEALGLGSGTGPYP